MRILSSIIQCLEAHPSSCRSSGAYTVLFDGKPVAVGEHAIPEQPNVKLIRMC
jgi:hypothetical protein